MGSGPDSRKGWESTADVLVAEMAAGRIFSVTGSITCMVGGHKMSQVEL